MSAVALKRGLGLKVPPESMSVEDFLTKIGRNAKEHAELFPSWKDFFTMGSYEMKEKGIETSLRRYIINWRYKYSQDPSVRLHQISEGKKIHGGERKRREVLAKERAQKRRELREKAAALEAA